MSDVIVIEPTELMVIAEQNELASTDVRLLIESFAPHYQAAQDIVQQAERVHVRSATQVTEIKESRRLRLALKDVRVAADKSRKTLKEDSLRRGRAIDGMNNVLLAIIKPVEDRLAEQEKIAERQEAARMATLKMTRQEILAPFGVDASYYNLGEMPEDTFANLFDSSRLAHEARIAATRKDEEDRIAAEQARLAEEKRIREENERLRLEAVEREKVAKAERAMAERQRAADAEKARKEREAIEARAKAEREAAEIVISREREAREKLEAERRTAAAAEQKRIDAEATARAKAERAPDREKLTALAAAFSSVQLPVVKSREAKVAIAEITAKVKWLIDFVEVKAKSL